MLSNSSTNNPDLIWNQSENLVVNHVTISANHGTISANHDMISVNHGTISANHDMISGFFYSLNAGLNHELTNHANRFSD